MTLVDVACIPVVAGICVLCGCYVRVMKFTKAMTSRRSFYVFDVLFRAGTGVWLICIGMTANGVALCIFSVLPSWPYALFDALHGEWGRFFCALIGGAHTMHYEGVAESPEVALLSQVLGAVPAMAVVAVAGNEGRDVLLTGGEETDVTRLWMFFVALAAGVTISFAASACVDAARPPPRGTANPVRRFETVLAEFIDRKLARLYRSLIHAIDAVTIVAIVGIVGGVCDRTVFIEWLAGLWFLCGVVPAFCAPPPMPTLRPAVPAQGLAWVLHRSAVTVLLTACPPLSYIPLLPYREQKVWAAAAMVRALYLIVTLFAARYEKTSVFIVFDTCIAIGALHTAIAAGGILCCSSNEAPKLGPGLTGLSIEHTESLLRASTIQSLKIDHQASLGPGPSQGVHSKPSDASDQEDGLGLIRSVSEESV